MKGTKFLQAAGLSGAVFIGGCAAVQPRQSFPDIERGVAERSTYRVHWNDGSAADQEAEANVASMLAQPLDADAAVQIALLNNRRLQATYESVGVAQADLVGAGLLRNPVFDGSVRFVDGGGKPNLDFGIAVDFLDVFFIGARKRLAESQLEAAKANITATVLAMAGETKRAFYDVQAAQQTVELRRQVAAATAASFDLAKRLRDAGNNSALDLAYEQAIYEEARLSLASAEAEVTAARESLSRAMGVWGDATQWTVAGRLPELPAEEVSADGLERRAIEKSLSLRASRARLNTTRQELGITKPLGVLSDIELGAVGERDDGEWEVGPSFALPLPIFGQGQPAVAAAQARVREAEQDYYAEAVELRSTVRAAYAQTIALRQQAEHYRRVLLPLRQTIVDETQLHYNAMQLGAFQLLQAKRDQVETASAYLEKLRDYWAAKTNLELLLQGGSATVEERQTSAARARSSSRGGGH